MCECRAVRNNENFRKIDESGSPYTKMIQKDKYSILFLWFLALNVYMCVYVMKVERGPQRKEGVFRKLGRMVEHSEGGKETPWVEG